MSNKETQIKIKESEKIEKKESQLQTYWPYYFMLLIEIGIIITYAAITNYSGMGTPQYAAQGDESSTKEIMHRYPFFQDVHVMIFIGFGFLMTFLKSYSWSAVGLNFIMGAWVIQISLLTNGLWKNAIKGKWETIEISLDSIIDADFAAGSVLIAFGGLLGKLNFIQYIFMATFQTIFYSLSFMIGLYTFNAVDIGGSMFIHAFGAYFGLAASFAYKGKIKDFSKCSANYNSNTFAFIDTVFLWMYWPSFNGALSSGHAQQRAIINTYLSLTGSCVCVFFASPLLRENKLHAEFVLNATLAGGVMIGSTADLIIKPWVALIIGFCAGFISLIGFTSVNQFLFNKINLHDTCGIHYLHGITGVIGGLLSILFSAMADEKDLGESYKILYKLWETRTQNDQALYQLYALLVVLGIAITSGLICGSLLRCFKEIKIPFDDEELWVTEEDELDLIKWKKYDEIVNSPTKKKLAKAEPEEPSNFKLQPLENKSEAKNIEMKQKPEEENNNNGNKEYRSIYDNLKQKKKNAEEVKADAAYLDASGVESNNAVDIEENPKRLRNMQA